MRSTRKKKVKKTRRTENLLRLFAALLRRQRPMTVDAIATTVGCSVRTAYRLVEEMRDAGLVRGGGSVGYTLRRPASRR